MVTYFFSHPRRLPRVPIILSLCTLCISMLVMVGWNFKIPSLVSVVPGFVSMKVNTALGFIFSSVAILWMAQGTSTRGARSGIVFLAFLVLCIGALSFIEYQTGMLFGLNEILYKDFTEQIATASPGLMAPSTAINYILLSIALLLFLMRSEIAAKSAHSIVIIVFFVSYLSLIEYALGVEIFFEFQRYTRIALNTAVLFMLLSVSIILLDPNRGYYLSFHRLMVSATEKKIFGSLFTGFIILFTVGVGVIFSSVQSRLRQEKADHVSRTLIASSELLASIEQIQSGTRGYLLTRDTSFLSLYYRGVHHVTQSLMTFDSLVSNESVNRTVITRIDAAVDRRMRKAEEVVVSKPQQSRYLTESLFANKALSDSIRSDIEYVTNSEKRHMKELKKEEELAYSRSSILIYSSTLLMLSFVLYAIAVIRKDIARRVAAEQALRGLNEELEARVISRTKELAESNQKLLLMNKELESFTYTVSHDLRAPLRHIHGFIDLLRNSTTQTFDEKTLRYITVISEASTKMSTLIDELLHFSRIGKSALHLHTVDLNVIVADVRNTLAPMTKGRCVTWNIGDLPCVHADSGLLTIVITNYLSNALKFTRDRAEAVIDINAQINNEFATVSVADNGAGFEMQYVDKLFGVFQRLHANNEFEGNGIGLASVRRIIRRHGGDTWAEGTPGKGATFYFSIPLSTPHHPTTS